MASKLMKFTSYEAENQLELSLKQAFELLEPKLRPPFSLAIPRPEEYLQLNQAIVYGILCEPHLAKVHLKHLHAIVADGYKLFLSLLVKIANELYPKLFESAKNQLIWVTKEMVDVSACSLEGLVVCFLRQIVCGDYSDGNLWLCFELVSLSFCKWDCLLEEQPRVMTSVLYTYLRLLADHCRLSNNAKVKALKELEIDFCVKMLREQFHLCLMIGRDLIRLLQDLVHVPEFRAIWKDLMLNPGDFGTTGFSDISQLYQTRTSSWYFFLRITFEMETQLRFLLTHVQLGCQKRYQLWFAKKFLLGPGKESIIVDIVRFICCAHHPSNEIIQSGITPRWAVIGWLLKCCKKSYVEANVKLALFYDWLFFDESVDSIMNIEPAMLLMVCSIPKYIDLTHSLLEFLLLLVDNYDMDHKSIIVRGVSEAFSMLVQKGVVHSLDVLTCCDALSPVLREWLQKFLLCSKGVVSKDMQPVALPTCPLLPLSFPYMSSLGAPTPSPKKQPIHCREGGLSTRPYDASAPILEDSVNVSSLYFVQDECQADASESFVKDIGVTIKESNKMSLQTLEAILLSFVDINTQGADCSSFCPEVLSSKIAKEFELNGYQLFSSLKDLPHFPDCDDDIGSATALITRVFVFSQHQRMAEMLLYWARNGFPVGARLLTCASRLACEAQAGGYLTNKIDEGEISDSGMPLLIFYLDRYFTLLNDRKEDSTDVTLCASKMDKKSITEMVDRGFTAYRSFLLTSRTILHKEAGTSLSKMLVSDLKCCLEWSKLSVNSLFCSILRYLSDLYTGEEDIIRLLLDHLDNADLIGLEFEIGLKRLSLFGESAEMISCLIKRSLSWNFLEQYKFWGLVTSELVVSEVPVEKIILEFFCSGKLDAKLSAIAVAGLLSLCRSHPPTPELVGAIMLLPNNNVFQDFAAAALSAWVVSNSSMLFDSLAKFSSAISNPTEIMINHSAMLWLLDYFNAHGMQGSNILCNFPLNISG